MKKLDSKILFTFIVLFGILANSFIFVCYDTETEYHLESLLAECSQESCSKSDFSSLLEFDSNKCFEKSILQDSFITEKEFYEFDKFEEKNDYHSNRLSEKHSYLQILNFDLTATLPHKIVATTSLLI